MSTQNGIRAKTIRVSIDYEKIIRKAQPHLKAEVASLESKFSETIKSPVFAWNRKTARKNGEVVYSPRNIVDEGDFISSLVISWDNPNKAVMTWNVPYARKIMFGTNKIPGRDWITFTMQKDPFIKFKHTRKYYFRP
jgi:hypothetical protein